jgi:hypothetical protein
MQKLLSIHDKILREATSDQLLLYVCFQWYIGIMVVCFSMTLPAVILAGF